WFTWSKMLTCYYLLLGLHFYLRWLRDGGRGPFAGFWAATLLGFMTHQVGAVYGLALLGHAAWAARRDPSRRPKPWTLAALGLSALAVAGPWYGWLAATFGPAGVVTSTPTSGMLGDARSTNLLSLLSAYAFNLAATVVPFRLIRSVFFEPFSIGAV